jgi:hypothetical protein
MDRVVATAMVTAKESHAASDANAGVNSFHDLSIIWPARRGLTIVATTVFSGLALLFRFGLLFVCTHRFSS